jgi:two-component system cell cycle sensor histidine kinase/response regulator CckA
VELDDSYVAGRDEELSPGSYVMLAVSDTGIGMDDETRARIFEPFFTTKAPGSGTGLGLSTVHGIIKQSQGHIAVYSHPGNGTVFKVYLPRVDESLPRTVRERAEDVCGEGERVLLVEDEEQVRTLVERVLDGCGYVVVATGDPWEALALCEKDGGAFDLVLSDIMMPGLNGAELRARLSYLQPRARFLFMSGYTDKAIVHRGILGADAPFIQKPFAPDALLRKVREVLDEARDRAA